MKTRTNFAKLLATLMLMMVCVEGWAYTNNPDFQVDGIWYSKTTVAGTVKVDWKGSLYFSGMTHNCYSGEITIPSTVEYQGETYTVTTIGSSTFYYCNVTAIQLPSTITKIETEGFRGCKFTEITLPSGLRELGAGAFANSSLKSCKLPFGIVEIPENLFGSCGQLTDVQLPSTIKKIGIDAFRGSTLNNIFLPNGLEEIGERAFRDTPLTEIMIPYTLKAIANHTFMGCTQLSTVEFGGPSNLKGIGNEAFRGCPITDITIPESVESIEWGAFYGCSQLENLTFKSPSKLKYIGGSAFNGNYGNKNKIWQVTIPASVDSIADYAFSNSQNLGTVKFEEGSNLRIIGNGAFDYTPITEIQIPEGVERIGEGAFQNCKSLTSISFPEGLKEIPKNLCFECTNLKQVTIPSSAKYVGEAAFRTYYYISEKSIDLKATLDSIGDAAFCGVGSINIYDYDAWVNLVVNYRPFKYDDSSNGYRYDYDYDLGIKNIYAYKTFAHIYLDGELVTNYTIPEGVTKIEEKTFAANTDIRSITFPQSLVTIESEAFFDCSNLETITFGDNVKDVYFGAFYNCNNIKTVDIGDLGNWCEITFYGNNTTAHKIVYANPLIQAGKIVEKDKQLSSLKIPSTVKRIGDVAFYGCLRFDAVSIPNSVESIGNFAFAGCSDLETVTFGKKPKLASIGNNAFQGTSIQTIQLPNSLTSIGESAFQDCKVLEEITIPEKVTEIKSQTFSNDSKLERVTLPEGLTCVGFYAFGGTCLKNIIIPSTVHTIGRSAFEANGIEKVCITDLAAWCNINFGIANFKSLPLYLNGELIQDLVIPDNVTRISPNAFGNAYTIKSITIPEGVKFIGNRCFLGCSGVTSLRLPSSLEVVEEQAFYFYANHDVSVYVNSLEDLFRHGLGNTPLVLDYHYTLSDQTNLYVNGKLIRDLVIPEGITSVNYKFSRFSFTTVTLPSTLESILYDCFHPTPSLKKIYSKSKFAPKLPSNGSYIPTGLGNSNNNKSYFEVIYVPAGRSNNYKSSWSGNADIIKEAPEDILLTGDQNLANITDSLQAHSFVYGRSVSCVDLSGATLAEDVTTEGLKEADADGNAIFFLPDGSEGFEGENMVVNGHATKIVLKDGADFAAPYDFTADEVVYERSFPADGNKAYPLCLPYTLPTIPEGLTAYSLTGQDSKGRLEFTETAQVVANQPYLVMASEDVTNLNAQNVQFLATPEDLPDAGIEGFEFRGTMMTMTGEDASFDWNAFVLQDDMTWAPVDANDERAIKPMTVFLSPDDDADILHITIGGKVIGRPFGDLDGDGLLSNKDVVALINIVLGKQPVPEAVGGKNPADINGDNQISIADVTTLVNIILGK